MSSQGPTINIPFTKAHVSGKEIQCIEEVISKPALAGDGKFTKLCKSWLEHHHNVQLALLTHSCTAALEMSAILANIQPGDEVILPSYTFVSTANAFILRGATPVFVDIRADTLNLDEELVESAITPATKAIVPVHYAGVGCEMDTISRLAEKYGLYVIEDAAQGIMSYYNNEPLGTIGDCGTLSFHETKNVVSGEGGALLIKNSEWLDRAEVIREKGTNRSAFIKGQVDKYTWQDIGSSFLPSELIAAFLYPQLANAKYITDERLTVWDKYHKQLESLEKEGLIKRPTIPENCTHNAHMYYILLNDTFDRNDVLKRLQNAGVGATFHYVPLHSSPYGSTVGRSATNMQNTNSLSKQILRLPLWVGLEESSIDYIVATLTQLLKKI